MAEIKTPVEVKFSPREQLYFKVCNVVQDDLVLNALKNLDRADFVPEGQKEKAYEDIAFDVAPDASISQVSLVGIMIEHLELTGGERVLEIGTGSGFEASWIGKVVGDGGKVITCEINEKLCSFAKENFLKVGIDNVEVINKDGSNGLPEYGHYDAIIASATFRELPESLLEQLNEGGRIVAPVGKDPSVQDLVVGRKVKGVMKYKTIDEAVWFHKVFSNNEGAWTKELLVKSRELKFQFAVLYIKFMSAKQRKEMWESLGSHHPEYLDKPIDENLLVQIFLNNQKGDSEFYRVIENKTDSTPGANVLE